MSRQIKGIMSKLGPLLIAVSLNLLVAKHVPKFPVRAKRDLRGYINGHGHHAVNNNLDNDDADAATKALLVQDNLRENGTLQDDGRICVQKLMNVKEKVFDDMMVCNHQSEKRCHETYKTVYVPHQVLSLIHI